jgi:hypothetical protein
MKGILKSFDANFNLLIPSNGTYLHVKELWHYSMCISSCDSFAIVSFALCKSLTSICVATCMGVPLSLEEGAFAIVSFAICKSLTSFCVAACMGVSFSLLDGAFAIVSFALCNVLIAICVAIQCACHQPVIVRMLAQLHYSLSSS